MKHKILSLVAAACITGTGLWVVPQAMATTTMAAPTQQQAFETLTKFCATSYREFRRYHTTKFLDQGLKRLDQNGRNTVALACYAYGKGYEDGKDHSNIA